MTCIVCFIDFNHKFKKTSCKKCKTAVCLQCSINNLNGMCVICDRTALNRQQYCKYCSKYVYSGKFKNYACNKCNEIFYSCINCYEIFNLQCSNITNQY